MGILNYILKCQKEHILTIPKPLYEKLVEASIFKEESVEETLKRYLRDGLLGDLVERRNYVDGLSTEDMG